LHPGIDTSFGPRPYSTRRRNISRCHHTGQRGGEEGQAVLT
jgi:hypothetical protein